MQVLSIDPENIEEKYRITVTGAVGNEFKINFINPNYDPDNANSVQIWTSDVISDGVSAGNMRNGIKHYYWGIWGANISVDRVHFDADDIETTDSDLIVKTVYTVTVLRRISGPSFSMASIVM